MSYTQDSLKSKTIKELSEICQARGISISANRRKPYIDALLNQQSNLLNNDNMDVDLTNNPVIQQMSGQIESIQTMLQQMQQLQAQQASRIPPLNHQPSFLPSLSQLLGIPAQTATQTNPNSQIQQQIQPQQAQPAQSAQPVHPAQPVQPIQPAQPAQHVRFQLPAQQILTQTNATTQPVAPQQQAPNQPTQLAQQQPAAPANDGMPASYSGEQLQDLFRSVNTRTDVKNTAQISQELNAGKYTRMHTSIFNTRICMHPFPFEICFLR